MSYLRRILPFLSAAGGLYVGLSACSAGGDCHPPRPMVMGTFTNLEVTHQGALPPALENAVYRYLEISEDSVVLNYELPSGEGAVTYAIARKFDF